ncbi:uncharacterized protein LOC130899332 [Diorhabda carinulata]|uniref:uncharacterized protein LOC130899332 n=1 Tax=Diorhabda carinulata TaxID=1163345 RepID=UPI0025A177E9|nr:uncharacterized protein LOC130899332 [Diorhabda carinulata]
MNKPKKSSNSIFSNNVQKSKSNFDVSKTTQNQNSKVKKVLVRNTERPVPEIKVVKSFSNERDNSPKKTEQVSETKTTVESFDTPEPYSTLSLSKQVDYITKYRKVKSVFEQNKKLAVDEKVSRQVNFPYNQPIYKNLIPLRCEKIPATTFTATRSPLPQKDKEVALTDFIKPRTVKNYYSLPSIDFEDKIVPCKNNNLRLYKILQINSR